METLVFYLIVFSLLIAFIILQNVVIKNHRQTMKDQQETIQKLLNREPVTYKEVNVAPPKPDTDRPIAWGGMIGNREEI